MASMPVEVLAVQHDVHGQRKSQLPGDLRGANFFIEGRRAARETVGIFRVRVLNAHLQTVESGGAQLRSGFFIEQRAAGAQVGVKADVARAPDDLRQVGSQQGFTAGEMGLHNAKLRGFGQDALPFGGGQFLRVPREVGRVAAIRTLQRATIRQLAKQ